MENHNTAYNYLYQTIDFVAINPNDAMNFPEDSFDAEIDLVTIQFNHFSTDFQKPDRFILPN